MRIFKYRLIEHTLLFSITVDSGSQPCVVHDFLL